MKSHRWLKGLGIWFAVSLVLYGLANLIFPVDAGNTLVMPSTYSVLFVIVPLAAAVYFSKNRSGFVSKRKREVVGRDGSIVEKPCPKPEKAASGVKIPFGRKKRNAAAQRLINEAKACAEVASKATEIPEFLYCWDRMIAAVTTLSAYEGKVSLSGELPSRSLVRFASEFQWKLRDAIERAERAAISDITGQYRNSSERKLERADGFLSDIKSSLDRFSSETATFADGAAAAVCKAAGIPYSAGIGDEPPADGAIPELSAVDKMEGLQFEHFCAELLRKSGFSRVQVTPGSGDQGVDVLAEKGGVKYAIQCKCYASDLGNASVQEVNTGKAVYRCHVGIVMTNRYFTQGAKEAAEATGVLLWDRDTLAAMIEAANG